MYSNIDVINIDYDIIFSFNNKKERKQNYELGLYLFFKLI